MVGRVEREGLAVDAGLASFIETEALPGTGIDAGRILSGGATVEAVGREIYETWLRMASGEKSKSEAQGLGDYEFVPWQVGAVM